MDNDFSTGPLHSPTDEPLPTRPPPPPVTRINRRALVAAGVVAAVLGALVLVIGFGDNRGQGKKAAQDANPVRPAEEFIGEQVRDLPKDYSFDVRNAASGVSYLWGASPPSASPSAATTRPTSAGPTSQQLALLDEEKRLVEARQLFLEQQRKELEQAMDSSLIFSTIKAERSGTSATNQPSAQQAFSPSAPGETSITPAGSVYPIGEPGTLQTATRGSGQSEKEAFMDKAAAVEPYLNKPLVAPLSKYELKAGSVIPGALITGINTDLPGQIIGQVTQNVYDSVTGDHLLIPQGSRLLGKYQSAISNGQNRALIVWQRLIYPDGHSIVLDGMPGTDAAGLSGLKDQVDYHAGRLAGAVALTTALAYAGNLARDPHSNADGESNADVVGDSVAQETNRVGEKIIDRELDVQPTITIRPGWPFRVLVNKDMVLAPYSPSLADTALTH